MHELSYLNVHGRREWGELCMFMTWTCTFHLISAARRKFYSILTFALTLYVIYSRNYLILLLVWTQHYAKYFFNYFHFAILLPSQRYITVVTITSDKVLFNMNAIFGSKLRIYTRIVKTSKFPKTHVTLKMENSALASQK